MSKSRQSLYSQKNRTVAKKPSKKDECVGISDYEERDKVHEIQSSYTEQKPGISQLVLREAQNTQDGQRSAREQQLHPIQEDEQFPFNNPIVVYLNVVPEDDKQSKKDSQKENEKEENEKKEEQKLKRDQSINKELDTKENKERLIDQALKEPVSEVKAPNIPRDHLHHIVQDKKDDDSETTMTVHLGKNNNLAVIGTNGQQNINEEERPLSQNTMAQMALEGPLMSLPNNTQSNFNNGGGRYKLNHIINNQEPSRQNLDRVKTSVEKPKKKEEVVNKSFDLKQIKQGDSENYMGEYVPPLGRPQLNLAIFDTERGLDDLKSKELAEDQRSPMDRQGKKKNIVNQQTQYFPTQQQYPNQQQQQYPYMTQHPQYSPYQRNMQNQLPFQGEMYYENSLDRDYMADQSLRNNMQYQFQQPPPVMGLISRTPQKHETNKAMRSTHQSLVEVIHENRMEEDENSSAAALTQKNLNSAKKTSNKDLQATPIREMVSKDIQVNSSKDLLPQKKASKDIQVAHPSYDSPRNIYNTGSKSQRVIQQEPVQDNTGQQSSHRDEVSQGRDPPINVDQELQRQLQDEEVGGARVSQSKSNAQEEIMRDYMRTAQELTDGRPSLEHTQENPLHEEESEVPIVPPLKVQFIPPDGSTNFEQRLGQRDEPMEMDPNSANEAGFNSKYRSIGYKESNRDEPLDAEPEYFAYLEKKQKEAEECKTGGEQLEEGGKNDEREEEKKEGDINDEEKKIGEVNFEEEKNEGEDGKSIQKMIEKYDKLEVEIKEVKEKLKPRGLEQFEIEDVDKTNKGNTTQRDTNTQRESQLMDGQNRQISQREESKIEENKEDYDGVSNANYEQSPPQFNNLQSQNQYEDQEERKSLNMVIHQIRSKNSSRSQSPEPNYESKAENESHYSHGYNPNFKSKLPLSAIKESSKDRLKTLHRNPSNRAPSFTSTQRKYEKGENRHKYCALGSLNSRQQHQRGGSVMMNDHSNSRSRDSSGEKLKSQMLMNNRNLNKLRVPPHKLPPFQPKFQHVESRHAYMPKKKKKDSNITLEESFDLKQFLNRNKLDPLVVKAKYQSNPPNDYEMMNPSYPMSNRGSRKNMFGQGSNMRNKLDFSTMQYDQVYKELYKKARNKKMADYFQNKDVMFPHSHSRPANQFHSLGGGPVGFMHPSQLFDQQHQMPNQYPSTQHVNHVQLMPINPQFQKSPNIYNPNDDLKNSIIDYKKTYNIVENIKKAYVKNKNNTFSYDQMDEQDKWNDLMGFMKKNPKVLMQMLPNGDEEEFLDFQQQFFTNPTSQKNMIKRAKKLGFKPKASLPQITQKNLDKIKKYRNQTLADPNDIKGSQSRKYLRQGSDQMLREERSMPLKKRIQKIDNFVNMNKKNRDSSMQSMKKEKNRLKELNSAKSASKLAIAMQKKSINRLSKPKKIFGKKQSVDDAKKTIQTFNIDDNKDQTLNQAQNQSAQDIIQMPANEKQDNRTSLKQLSLADDLNSVRQAALESVKSKTFYNTSGRNQQQTQRQSFGHYNQNNEDQIVKNSILNSQKDNNSDLNSLLTELNELKQEKEQLRQLDSQIKRDKDKLEKERAKFEKKKQKLEQMEQAKRELEEKEFDFKREKERLDLEQKDLERMNQELKERSRQIRKKSSIENSPRQKKANYHSIESQEQRVEDVFSSDRSDRSPRQKQSKYNNKYNSDSKTRFPSIGNKEGQDNKVMSHSKLQKGKTRPRVIKEEDEYEDNDKVLNLTQENLEDFKFQENNRALAIFDEDGISNLAPSEFTGLTKMQNQFSMGMKRNSIGRPDSPNGSLKTFNGTTMGPLYDWAQSPIMEDILNNKLYFNHDNNTNFYKEGEISFVIDMLKKNHNDFRKPHLVQPYYNKALETLREVMTILNLGKLFIKIKEHYAEVSLQNTFKLLVRCKLMIQARNMLYQTIKDIQRQESLIHDLRYIVDSHLDSSISDTTKKKIEELAMKLPSLTQQIKEQIVKLREEHRLFTKTAATTSRNSFVTNVFVYKKKDALKTCVAAYEEVRKLISVFDIEKMPYISEKVEKQ